MTSRIRLFQITVVVVACLAVEISGLSSTSVCGGEVLSEDGELQSPNYPDDYSPNNTCIWRITVPDTFQVALKFVYFEVENDVKCAYDYVELRDGHDATGPLLGRFCGDKIPDDVQSSGHRMLVKFVSDGSVQKAGFSATFTKARPRG